jgi:uncharacterized protein DUF3106
MALALSAGLPVLCLAQGQHANGAQNRQDNKPPRQQSQPPRQSPPREQPPRQQRQEQRREQRQQGHETRRPQNDRQNSGASRPPNANTNRPPATDINRAGMVPGSSNNPNRPPSAYTPAPQKKFNQLSPQEQRRVVDSYNKQKNLTPAQRQEIDGRIKNWEKLTPEQKSHVRNDLAPKWNQLPPNRQRAIQQRLGVLQNMPESARNQHLNDPNFTRGMGEEDKAMLRDLSHMHMGAPDPPNE